MTEVGNLGCLLKIRHSPYDALVGNGSCINRIATVGRASIDGICVNNSYSNDTKGTNSACLRRRVDLHVAAAVDRCFI
jgi:hypothetical protein